MNKFKEIVATWFAVLGILAFIFSVGAVEADNYMIAFVLFVIGISTMFISIVYQEKQ